MQNKLWGQVGVDFRLTDEEMDTFLNFDSNTDELFANLVEERRYRINDQFYSPDFHNDSGHDIYLSFGSADREDLVWAKRDSRELYPRKIWCRMGINLFVDDHQLQSLAKQDAGSIDLFFDLMNNGQYKVEGSCLFEAGNEAEGYDEPEEDTYIDILLEDHHAHTVMEQAGHKGYTLNELIEKMKPQAEKDNALMRECVKGLALYAGQRAQADPLSPEISEMRSLVEEIACYWGLDDGDQEKLQTEFMQPFDDTVAGALTGESLDAEVMLQRAGTIHGLYRYGLEMACAQGIESKDDILAMSGLMRKLASAWDFESDLLNNMANGLAAEVCAMETAHESEQPDQGMGQSL